MKKIILSLLLVLFLASPALSANWYVRPSGGSGSGLSELGWTAAWNGMNGINWGSVSCGDTIWVAGGTYNNTLTPNKACTSGNRLYVKRARADASECTGAAGWSSDYDATINHTGNDRINFDSGYTNRYITISGRTSANPGHWSGYGWYMNMTGTTGGTTATFRQGTTQGITLEYIDFQGPGEINYTSEGTAIDLLQYSGSLTELLVSHVKIHGFSSGIYMCGVPVNPIFEYIDMYDNKALNSSSYHPDGWYTCGINGFTVRYSKLHGVNIPTEGFANEGIFHGGCGGVTLIYGNAFYIQTASYAKSIEMNASTGACTMQIFNNTFYNIYNPIWESQDDCSSSSQTRNNIFYNAAGRVDTCGTHSNNLTINTGTIFTNAGASDFTIVETTGANYPRNAGTNLSAYFTTDMNGTAFGGDGTWDIGAYEYGAGGDTTPPTVTITSPTSNPTYSVATTPITLSGTASDDVGVISVSYSNDRGGSGSCTGTTSWTCPSTGGVILQPGVNVITVSASDAVSNIGTDVITVTYDNVRPTISSVTSTTATGSYKDGVVIPVTVNFSEAVTSTGNVTVNLNVTGRSCTFPITNSSSGSCNYTVQAGDTESTGLNVSSISGTITDQVGNVMNVFTIPTNLYPTKVIKIDTTVPTITNVTSTKANGTYTTGEIIDIVVTFSEAVTSTGNVTVTLETGTPDRTCTFTVSNNNTGSCNYTVQSGDISIDLNVNTISGTIADLATNAITNFSPAVNLAANKHIIINTVFPTTMGIFAPTGVRFQ